MDRRAYLEKYEVASTFRPLPGENWNEVFRNRLKAVGLQITDEKPHVDEEWYIQAPAPTANKYGEPHDPFTDKHAWYTPAWIVPDNGLPPVATQVQDLKDTLRLFREFYTFYVERTKLGASHHHPIWQRIAEALGEDNDITHSGPEWKYITGPYYEAMKTVKGEGN